MLIMVACPGGAPAGTSTRHFTRFRRLRQRGKNGGILGADLAIDKGWHDAPRLTGRPQDLRGIQSAPREIRAETAFTHEAMTILAIGRPGCEPVPIGFAGRGIAGGLCERGALRKRQREKRK